MRRQPLRGAIRRFLARKNRSRRFSRRTVQRLLTGVHFRVKLLIILVQLFLRFGSISALFARVRLTAGFSFGGFCAYNVIGGIT